MFPLKRFKGIKFRLSAKKNGRLFGNIQKPLYLYSVKSGKLTKPLLFGIVPVCLSA